MSSGQIFAPVGWLTRTPADAVQKFVYRYCGTRNS
jgi:hypothetical protein